MGDFDIVLIRGQRHAVCQCGTCGVFYTSPEIVRQHHFDEGGYDYCPNGHQWGRNKDGSQLAQMRRERDRLAQQIAMEKDETARERSLRVGAEKRERSLKKRASAGMCPCCNRPFFALALHMKKKHPKFVAENVVPPKAAS